jgi:hypothetical protein
MAKYIKCLNCDKEITRGSKSGFCRSCCKIKENPKYKQKYYCIKCDKEICYKSFHCSSKMCIKCCRLGKKRKPHTKETKEKIRQSNLGQKRSKETREKMSKSHKGKSSPLKDRKLKPLTKQHKQNISKSQLKRFKDHKERERISKSLKGREVSEETRAKISKSNLGKKRSEEIKRNISLAHGGTGIPHENSIYPPEFTQSLRNEIKERDNHICQGCSMTQEEHLKKYNRSLEIHHIDYNVLNCNENNLITTCKLCNLNANSNRDYWFAFYSYIMEEKYAKIY